MKIDSLQPFSDGSGRYRVQLDNGRVLRLYRQTVEDYAMYTGMELSEEELNRIEISAGEMSAKMRAVRIVSSANVSVRELEQRLIHKGENPQHARQAVDWLEDLKILDDRKTAEQLIQSCISKGYGPARAKQILFEKKIPRDIREELLADYPEQRDAVESFLRSKLTADSDQRDIKRAVDALVRRGHSGRVIFEVLRGLSFAPDDFPEDD